MLGGTSTSAIISVTTFLSCFTNGQISVLDDIQRRFLKQGLPFRENVFLDDRPILPEYDFVIVGSGPGGSTIANRLTEVPQWKVLLIEAGQEGNIYNDIPVINAFTILGNLSVILDVEKEENVCGGLTDGICHWPMGQGVGGASLINAMIWTRGHPSDFDRWAEDGNPGWSYWEILPYFLKSENMTIDQLRYSQYHSTQGPVTLEPSFQTDLSKRFIKAGLDLGYNEVDYNDPNTMYGFSRTQVATKDGKRVSAASAYLHPVKNRRNLHIVKNARVTKILIDPKTKRAFGISFINKGQQRKVFARNEVIVAGGAFGSPHLLMLSGIGPAEHLNAMNIPVVQDLPVGNNLQEHLGAITLSFLIDAPLSFTLQRLLQIMTEFPKWLAGKRSAISHNIAEALAYIKTPLASDKADIELIFLPFSLSSDAGLIIRKTLAMTDETYEKSYSSTPYAEAFTISPMAMYPKSKGTIRLRSRNPLDPPVIDSNFFNDPYDIKVIIEGIRFVLKLTQTEPFRSIGTRQYKVPLAGCENFEFNSDEYWDCAIRRVPIQFHHQCGTCRMGPDPSIAVVDPRLKVHGVAGLRVVDASIMPYIPGPHTMASTYMIGEKAADLIKEDWGVF